MDKAKQCEAELLQRVQQLERKFERIASWLGSELGYDTEAEGNVNRTMNETNRRSTEALTLLRGEKDQIGLVGKVEILFRSWHILLSLVAALAGYLVRLVTES